MRTDAVGEPARVGHFVDGVHVARTGVGRLVARGDEQVVRILVEQLDAERHGFGRVLALRFPGDRVVVVKLRTGRQDGHDRQCGQQRDDSNESSTHRSLPQKAWDAAHTIEKPSDPLANSIRSGVAIGPWKRKPMPTSFFRSSSCRSWTLCATRPVS